MNTAKGQWTVHPMILDGIEMDAETFDRLNADDQFGDWTMELIGGKLYTKFASSFPPPALDYLTPVFTPDEGDIDPIMPSNAKASEFSAYITIELGIFLRENNLGRVTGENGGYMVAGQRVAPDVTFIAHDKGDLDDNGYNRMPPDLAVEVEYHVTKASARNLKDKLAAYAAAGTVVWVVYPERRMVEVFVPGEIVRVYDADGTIDGGTVLPGFTLSVGTMFDRVFGE
ncbi:MAG: Uma2 family endonuclease [bacterium]|nr:Uma2 family endonuclease [bacterium]